MDIFENIGLNYCRDSTQTGQYQLLLKCTGDYGEIFSQTQLCDEHFVHVHAENLQGQSGTRTVQTMSIVKEIIVLYQEFQRLLIS